MDNRHRCTKKARKKFWKVTDRNVKLFIFLLMTLLLSACKSSQTPDTTWSQMNLEGKVDTIVSSYYNPEGDTSPYYVINDDFNSEGMLTKSTAFDDEGNIIDETYYTYLKNKKISKVVFLDEELHGASTIEVNWSEDYLKSESLFLSTNGSLNQKLITEYLNDNLIEKLLFFDSEDELINTNEYIYNDDMKITNIIRKDLINNHHINYSIRLDAVGNIIQELGIDENKQEKYMTKREYDSYNNLLLESVEMDGFKIFYSRYEYEYDTNNNWIKRNEYDEKSHIQTVIREIKYYK